MLVAICFLSACRQRFESVNIEKFFPFVADFVFRAIVDVLCFGVSVRDKFILVLGRPNVGSLISSENM